MAENPKWNLTSCEVYGLEEKMNPEKILVLDDLNGFQYTAGSESFIINMDTLSNSPNKEIPADSRTTLQRNFSRKVFQHDINKKITSNTAANGGDLVSPRGSQVGLSTPQKAVAKKVGCSDHPIAITTSNISVTTERAGSLRRNSSNKRSSTCRIFNPRNIVIFMATVSSMGTLLLIFMTLRIRSLTAENLD